MPVSALHSDVYAVRSGIEGQAFDELVSSVRRDGVLQPILVEREGDRFVVVAGHRRTAAARAVGLVEIPAVVVSGGEEIGWRGSFAENMYRADLSPVEEAAALRDCLEGGDLDVDGVAAVLGRSRAWVDGRLAILEWPEDVQMAVHAGSLSVGGAAQLAGIADGVYRAQLIEFARVNGASVRTCAAWRQAYEMGRLDRPGDIEVPEGSGSRVAAAVPYTPCVICGGQHKMAELSWLPVCGDCDGWILQLSSKVRGQGEGAGVGG